MASRVDRQREEMKEHISVHNENKPIERYCKFIQQKKIFVCKNKILTRVSQLAFIFFCNSNAFKFAYRVIEIGKLGSNGVVSMLCAC